MELTFLLPSTSKCNSQEQIYLGGLVNEFIILKNYLNGNLCTELSIQRQRWPGVSGRPWSPKLGSQRLPSALGYTRPAPSFLALPLSLPQFSPWARGRLFVSLNGGHSQRELVQAALSASCNLYKVRNWRRFHRRGKGKGEIRDRKWSLLHLSPEAIPQNVSFQANLFA